MNPTPSKKQRLLSLDVFRGLTIVLMILVNGQGTRTPYSLLAHADWNGCTLADLVFPSFLFIVGLSIVFSLKAQLPLKPKASLYYGILRRSCILFLIGLFLNAIPLFSLEHFRVYGVLQRIALCYFFCALIYLNFNLRTQVFIFLGILLGYWILMTQIPVPDFGAGQLTKAGTWVAYLDQSLFSSAHLYEKVYDPEGFLSTFPAIASTLLGLLMGQLLFSSYSRSQQCVLMATLGLIFLLLGGLWDFSFPINKDLWTSSFVLWTSGVSLLSFAFCFLVIDIWGYQKWAWPLKVFGMNALFAFVVHVFLIKIQSIIHLPLRNGNLDGLRSVISDHLFGYYGPQNAALMYALLFLFLNFLLVAGLYRYKIFIRI